MVRPMAGARHLSSLRFALGQALSAAKDLSLGSAQIQSSREDACPQRSEGMTAGLKFTPMGQTPPLHFSH